MKFSSLHLKVFATILFVGANAMNQANAQTPALAKEDLIVLPTPQPVKMTLPRLIPGEKFILVTSKDPTVKRTCHVESTSGDEIRCKQHSHPAIYRMADLDAIIEPGTSRFEWLTFIFPFAIGGSIITGACFLGELSAIAIIGAVPIGLIGLFFVGFSLIVATDRDDDKLATVLYQKPGTTLAVKLR